MSMEKIFGVAGSALAAQLVRMNTTASNLANSSNTADSEEAAYKAKRVVFRTLLSDHELSVTKLVMRDQSTFKILLMTQPLHLSLTIQEIHLRTRTAMFIRATSTRCLRWWK